MRTTTPGVEVVTEAETPLAPEHPTFSSSTLSLKHSLRLMTPLPFPALSSMEELLTARLAVPVRVKFRVVVAPFVTVAACEADAVQPEAGSVAVTL